MKSISYTERAGFEAAQRAFTLVELLVVIAIAIVIAAVAVPMYRDYVFEAQVRTVIGDIKQTEVRIERFRTENYRLPNTLAELGHGSMRDPWGRAYAYLNIEDGGAAVAGKVRKDKNLVPINSDYDLYSPGLDGNSQPPLTAPPSKDDVVRAGDGGFVGLADQY
jgi:general secretion pathway protein G